MLTLEQLLQRTSDDVLIEIALEINETVVPALGYAHVFCRKINQMIDKGELCINPTTYRKIYLPTLARAVQKELASRYILAVKTGELSR